MNILLLTYEYPPIKGGIATYLSNLVAHKPDDVEVKVDIPKKGEHWIGTSLRLLLSPERYDLTIISHALPAGYAAWFLNAFRGTPYIAIVHGTDILTARANFWKRSCMRFVLKRAKIVVANSRFTAGLLKEEGIKKVEIVPPGIAPSPFIPPPVGERVAEGRERVILAVGRLIPRKGFDTLIRAFPAVMKETPEARVKIIGRGDYFEELDRIAHEFRVENFVEIITDADDDAKRKHLSEAEVFTLPARKVGDDVEGFGIAILEASAAGLPVVVGRSGGAPETIVNGVTGILVEPDDSDGLARTLIRLLKNPEEAKKMGEEGRRYVTDEYSISKTAKSFWELMQNSPYPPFTREGTYPNPPLEKRG